MPPKIESGSTSDNPNVTLNDQLQVLIHLATANNHCLDTITNHLVEQYDNMNNIVKNPRRQQQQPGTSSSVAPIAATTPTP